VCMCVAVRVACFACSRLAKKSDVGCVRKQQKCLTAKQM